MASPLSSSWMCSFSNSSRISLFFFPRITVRMYALSLASLSAAFWRLSWSSPKTLSSIATILLHSARFALHGLGLLFLTWLKWQNLQFSPLKQPDFARKYKQGLHSPLACSSEPMDGRGPVHPSASTPTLSISSAPSSPSSPSLAPDICCIICPPASSARSEGTSSMKAAAPGCATCMDPLEGKLLPEDAARLPWPNMAKCASSPRATGDAPSH
mmetsp:Transcript_46821/g.111391  ORF Transcript_46821/g.111391 Transcript_46821/m.111391 type:complete len:214 (+) Transcript_46821:423-1064(+)